MNLQDEAPILTVSPSRLSVYRTCPKLHDYQYNQQLVKIGAPQKHFDKGNYFHELLHVYYRYLQSGVQPGSRTAIELMRARIKEDLTKNVAGASPADLQSRIQLFDTILRQFMLFVEKRSPEIDEGIEVLGVEEEILVPVELPSGRIIYLHGFIDLRYRKSYGLRIRDHKTDASSSLDRSIFNWGGVGLSPQLLFYGAAKYVETGDVHSVEISWLNTKDFKTKKPSYAESFALWGELHSEVTYQNYLVTTLQLIDQMLDSPPIPYYDEKVCKYCPFLVPCIGERRGIPSERILAFNYERRTKSRERTLNTEDSGHDEINSIS